MFKFEIDEQDQILRVKTAGFWSLDEADQFIAEFGRVLEGFRRRFGQANILMDARESAVQSPETAQRLQSLRELFPLSGDKFAMVVGSALKKMQVSRGFSTEDSLAFLSIEDAESWLKASRIPQRRAS